MELLKAKKPIVAIDWFVGYSIGRVGDGISIHLHSPVCLREIIMI